MTEESNLREKIIGITIHVLINDNSIKTITIDPETTEALFWSDRAVHEILAPFYNQKERFISKNELIQDCGEKICKIIDEHNVNNNNEVHITPDFVKNMWTLTNENGASSPYILKPRKCIPTVP